MSKYNKRNQPLVVTETAAGSFHATKPGYYILAFTDGIDATLRGKWITLWGNEQQAWGKPWFVANQWVQVDEVNIDVMLCTDYMRDPRVNKFSAPPSRHAIRLDMIDFLAFPMVGL